MLGSESISDLSFSLEIRIGSEVQSTQKVQSAQKFGFRSFGIWHFIVELLIHIWVVEN